MKTKKFFAYSYIVLIGIFVFCLYTYAHLSLGLYDFNMIFKLGVLIRTFAYLIPITPIQFAVEGMCLFLFIKSYQEIKSETIILK